eukprot:TRINITY_DN68167_c8_g4_i1.p1 TRINITY_DN68167_c8_g4~~TRINITY_DN68167_c8_g4_i1.p1  ORF type:complete len:467 (+),score=66.48 TRINITY_DN68167_c8_g4_i1:117-1517(+)
MLVGTILLAVATVCTAQIHLAASVTGCQSAPTSVDTKLAVVQGFITQKTGVTKEKMQVTRGDCVDDNVTIALELEVQPEESTTVMANLNQVITETSALMQLQGIVITSGPEFRTPPVDNPTDTVANLPPSDTVGDRDDGQDSDGSGGQLNPDDLEGATPPAEDPSQQQQGDEGDTPNQDDADGVAVVQPMPPGSCSDLLGEDLGQCGQFLGWGILNGNCHRLTGCQAALNNINHVAFTDSAACSRKCTTGTLCRACTEADSGCNLNALQTDTFCHFNCRNGRWYHNDCSRASCVCSMHDYDLVSSTKLVPMHARASEAGAKFAWDALSDTHWRSTSTRNHYLSFKLQPGSIVTHVQVQWTSGQTAAIAQLYAKQSVSSCPVHFEEFRIQPGTSQEIKTHIVGAEWVGIRVATKNSPVVSIGEMEVYVHDQSADDAPFDFEGACKGQRRAVEAQDLYLRGANSPGLA